VIDGDLSAQDLELIRRYIMLNRAAILDYWHEHTDGYRTHLRTQIAGLERHRRAYYGLIIPGPAGDAIGHGLLTMCATRLHGPRKKSAMSTEWDSDPRQRASAWRADPVQPRLHTSLEVGHAPDAAAQLLHVSLAFLSDVGDLCQPARASP